MPPSVLVTAFALLTAALLHCTAAVNQEGMSTLNPANLAVMTVALKPDHNHASPMDQFMLLSLANKAKYCYLQGYDFLPVFWSQHIDKHHPSWLKIPAIKHYLQRRPYEWIWALDLDAFIMNPHLSIQDHVLGKLRNPRASLLISMDCNGINGGSFFIRSTPWAMDFLDKVWELRSDKEIPNIKDWWEQAAMAQLLKDMSVEELEANVEFLPQKSVNAYINDKCGAKWRDGDYVLHLAGVPDKLATIQGYSKYLGMWGKEPSAASRIAVPSILAGLFLACVAAIMVRLHTRDTA